ncbi:MAG: membrane protein insertion efficiency factor YidD [Candidatus Eremiobacteraeota bacterium]|nr:membrane protein insertion efficiency factor YidD [Candidatus Eremiobacteraeota bacterium]
MRLALVGLIRIYQILLSPLLPSACRFYPSCSQYAIDALREHGPGRGVWLAALRLARCNPWHPGGVDYVPLNARLQAPAPTIAARVPEARCI